MAFVAEMRGDILGWFYRLAACAAMVQASVVTAWADDEPIVCSGGTATPVLSVLAGEITNMIQRPANGPYVQLLREVEAETGIHFDISVVSDRRAKRDFREGQADAYLIRSNFDEELSPIQVALDRHGLYAFVRKGNTPPRSLEDLAGKSLGLPYLYSFPPSLMESTSISVVRLAESAQANLEALALGRVDATIVPLVIGEDYVRNTGAALDVDMDHPVLFKEAFMVFRPSLGCMADQIEIVIEAMRKDGRLAKILTKSQ